MLETYTSFGISVSSHIGGGIDAAGYPRLLGAASVCIGVLLFAGAFFMPEPADGRSRHGRLWAPVALIATLIVYFEILLLFGYAIATPFLIAGLLLLSGERRPLVIVPVAIAVTAGFFVLFRFGAGILLPEGRLMNLGW